MRNVTTRLLATLTSIVMSGAGCSGSDPNDRDNLQTCSASWQPVYPNLPLGKCSADCTAPNFAADGTVCNVHYLNDGKSTPGTCNDAIGEVVVSDGQPVCCIIRDRGSEPFIVDVLQLDCE